MKDPAFLFYSSDFLSGTMLMTDEDVGQYIRLLCLQHQKGHLKEKDMLNICKKYNEDIFSKFKKDEDGNYYNERLEYESNKRKAYSESRRNNRKKKEIQEEENISNTYEKDMKNICNSYEKHMGNENENININIIKNKDKDNRGMGEEEKGKKRKTFEDVFYENQFPKELEITIKDFMEMRKTLKKPMTVKALELLIRNLKKLTNLEEEQIAILNQSIEHGWQTVYPLKTISSNSNNKNGMNDFKQLWEEARQEDEQTGNCASNNTFSW